MSRRCGLRREGVGNARAEGGVSATKAVETRGQSQWEREGKGAVPDHGQRGVPQHDDFDQGRMVVALCSRRGLEFLRGEGSSASKGKDFLLWNLRAGRGEVGQGQGRGREDPMGVAPRRRGRPWCPAGSGPPPRAPPAKLAASGSPVDPERHLLLQRATRGTCCFRGQRQRPLLPLPTERRFRQKQRKSLPFLAVLLLRLPHLKRLVARQSRVACNREPTQM